MARYNPNFKSEKVNGKKKCCVCGILPRVNTIYDVGNNGDIVCGDQCMDRYYEDAIGED